jgi:type VI secretion system protein ImpF
MGFAQEHRHLIAVSATKSGPVPLSFFMDTYSPSLLDKLLGTGGDVRDGTALRMSVEQVKDSVARDIEMFLNAHQNHSSEELRGMPNAARSVLTLGLIDISSMSLSSATDRRRITDAIREGLMTHDRRLSNVEVGVREASGSTTNLSFTIRAQLMLRPNSEHVVFDAVLQPASQRYDVSKADKRHSPPPA